MTVLGQVGVKVFLAKHAVNGFSQRGTLPRPEAKLAEILRQHHVGGLVKFENVLEKIRATVEKGFRMHIPIVPFITHVRTTTPPHHHAARAVQALQRHAL